MGVLATAVGATALIGGFVAQNVTIVWWLQTKGISPYGVLLLCGFSFAGFFTLLALLYALVNRDWSVFSVSDDVYERRLFISPFRPSGFRLSHAQTLALVGFCNSLNGWLIVYASPADRTPPLIQAVLQNCGVLFSVPAGKFILGDKKRYCAVAPLLAAGVIVASMAVSLAPTISAVVTGSQCGGSSESENFDGFNSLAWTLVYIAGLAPNALLNTLQQLYFLRTGMLREGVTPRDELRATLRALMFANWSQCLSFLAFFWLDLLPWFGSSSSLSQLWDNAAYSLACSIGGPGLVADAARRADCSGSTPAWAWAFIGSYAVAYLGGAQTNKESSVFSMLCLVVVTTATAATWEIPGVNPNPSCTPLWSVLVSLAASLVGSALWKRWEARTPASEQFSVLDEADGGGYPLAHGGYDGLLGDDGLALLGFGRGGGAGKRAFTFDGDGSLYAGSEMGESDGRSLLADESMTGGADASFGFGLGAHAAVTPARTPRTHRGGSMLFGGGPGRDSPAVQS